LACRLVCTVPPPHALAPLSLHDALPIWFRATCESSQAVLPPRQIVVAGEAKGTGVVVGVADSDREGIGGIIGFGKLFKSQKGSQDRKSTRLNSSHVKISYAVFCLKKKT